MASCPAPGPRALRWIDEVDPGFGEDMEHSPEYLEAVRNANKLQQALRVSDAKEDGLYVDLTAVPAAQPAPVAEPPKPPKPCCIICMDADASAVLVHGKKGMREGHMCVCAACAEEVYKRNIACPICRAKVTDWVKVFGM